jgi:hypothetical protein
MKIKLFILAAAVISFITAYLLPFEDIMRSIYAAPGVLALIGVVYQFIRDESAHRRAKELVRLQHIFEIGAASHMANTIFNKHVEFCEKYISEVHETVNTMYRRGPTTETLTHANTLYRLRQEYAAWLTEEINEDLSPFEDLLRKMGASKGFIDDTQGDAAYQGTRSKEIKQLHKDFKNLLGIENGQAEGTRIDVEGTKKKIRLILGIEEMLEVRKYLVNEARNAINI